MIPGMAYKEENQNDLPDIVSIGRDRLELILNRHLDSLARSSDWKTPLGIVLTLGLPLAITDFKDKAILTGAQWQVVVAMFLIGAIFWLIKTGARASRSSGRKDLLLAICKQADRLDDYHGVFFYRSNDTSGTNRILVYYDIVWECYLLPHVTIKGWDLNDVSADRLLSKHVSLMISVSPTQVKVTPLRDLIMRSTKFSRSYRRDKRYTFDFLHVVVKEPVRSDIKHASFISGGREYKWMSIPDLLLDPNTVARNSDVIHHLESHSIEFFIQTSKSMQNEIVEYRRYTRFFGID